MKEYYIPESNFKQLVETEMSEGSHNDFIEDYDSYEDFCLSNVSRDSYLEYLAEVIKNDLNKELSTNELMTIQNDIIKEIKNRISE